MIIIKLSIYLIIDTLSISHLQKNKIRSLAGTTSSSISSSNSINFLQTIPKNKMKNGVRFAMTGNVKPDE